MQKEEAGIIITVFTDPLCCWSWAFESQLQQLSSILGNRVKWRFRMAGLISTWDHFRDDVNNVSRPVQMGPVWMHAGAVSGRPVTQKLWITDPPYSSYPACIAVKCAQLQSEVAGRLMLFRLWQAAMTEGKNIAKTAVLMEVARGMRLEEADFNYERFRTDYENNNAVEAFREDLDLVQRFRLNRFPALVINVPGSAAMVIAGYKQYEEVLKSIESLAEPRAASQQL